MEPDAEDASEDDTDSVDVTHGEPDTLAERVALAVTHVVV